MPRMSKTVEIIKRLRSAGLSQSEIARRTGVAQSRISRWANGSPAAAADDVLKLQELAVNLGLTPDSASTPLVGESINA
jgi:transcriptional regulator with XRE-family HTH domain